MIGLGHTSSGMNGTIEDAVASAMKNAIMGGASGSAQSKERAVFYSDVLSKTADKFIATPGGKKALASVSWSVALPSFAVGLLVGYLLWKGKR